MDPVAFSIGLALFALLGVLLYCQSIYHDHMSKHRDLIRYQHRMHVYQILLNSLLERPLETLPHWLTYAVKRLRFEVLYKQAPEQAIEELVLILEDVVAARQPPKPKHQDFILPSPQAMGLIHFLHTKRHRLKLISGYTRDESGVHLRDYEADFNDLMPRSPIGELPPRLHAKHRKGYDGQRIVDVVIWADTFGGIDHIEQFLKDDRKWCLA